MTGNSRFLVHFHQQFFFAECHSFWLPFAHSDSLGVWPHCCQTLASCPPGKLHVGSPVGPGKTEQKFTFHHLLLNFSDSHQGLLHEEPIWTTPASE